MLLLLSVGAQVLLDLLHMALVEQRRSGDGRVSTRQRRGGRVPGQLAPSLPAEVHVQPRPAVKRQRVEEPLHGVQDRLRTDAFNQSRSSKVHTGSFLTQALGKYRTGSFHPVNWVIYYTHHNVLI